MFLSAQKEYFINNDGDEVLEHKALYKRVVEKIEKSNWKVSDYYLDGSLQMTGFFSDKQLTIEKDTFTWYFISGRMERKVAYNEKGRNGTYESYFFKGNKSSLGQYKDGKKDGKWLEWNFEGMLTNEKEYSNGNPTNTWIWYDSLGLVKYKIEDANQTKIDNLLERAKLKNGMTFQEYFATIEYPKEVLDDNIIGITYLEYTIDTNGLVKDVEIIIQSDIRLSTAAVNHTLKMPECIPGKHLDRKIETVFNVPINFRLENDVLKLTDSQKADQFFNSALKAAQQKKYDIARRRLFVAVSFKPTDVDINYLLGTMSFQLEDYADACKYWTLAYTLNPDKVDDKKKCFCEIPKCNP